jgi:hypothetical protein
MERFTHFEFATDDREKTAAFYCAVFGWKVEKWEGPDDYWLVTTGDESTPGLNGGLMQAGGDFSGTVNTVGVEDIDATLAKVKANGGTVIFEKSPVPGVGQLAYFKDNCGIVVGLFQPDPDAAM